MEFHNSIYILLIVMSVMFASQASNVAIKRGKQLWTTIPFYMLLVTFAFIVGTRYMVGMDYVQYMSVVEKGDSHYYYENLEFLNRFFIDVVNGLNFKFYWWFIFMAFVQILFITIAVKNNLRKVFPWIILSFFMLYISFYMNGVRQGAALSCFICATAFIKERKLYHYLAIIFIGTLFHRSIIIWTPVYWIVNKELFQNIKTQYLLLGVSIVVFPIVFDVIVQKLLPFMSVIGYENQASSLNAAQEDIAIGSGLGVAFRYLRWIIIIAYYNKLKNVIKEEEFIPLYNLFFIGILLDAATMQVIILNRLVMYGAIFEIFILGNLLYYMSRTSNKMDKIIISTLFILQMYLSFIPVFSDSFKWFTIWDAPYL